MGLEENKAIVRRLYEEVFNTGNFASVDELVDENVVMHEQLPGMPQGRPAIVAVTTWLRTVFPDFYLTLEEMVAEGDKVVVRFGGSGTHTGPYAAIPPTGRQISLNGFEVYRLAAGKVVELRILPDRLNMLQQMGAMPGPGQAR